MGDRDTTVAELPISITVAAQTLAPLQSNAEKYGYWGITQFTVTVEPMANLPVLDCQLLRDGIDVGAPDELLETPHVSDRTPGVRPETEGITVVFYDVSSFQRCSPGSDCTVHYLLSCSCLPGSGSDLTALVDVNSSVGGPLADGEPSVKSVRIEPRRD